MGFKQTLLYEEDEEDEEVEEEERKFIEANNFGGDGGQNWITIAL